MSSASSSNSSPPQDGKGSQLNGATTRSRRHNVDYGVRSLAKLSTREVNAFDVYRWEEDDLSLRSAAVQARLPYDKMTPREIELFPEMVRSQHSVSLFLYIRNKTLVQWQLNQLVELTFSSIQKELPEPFNSDVELVKSIHNYLERYGYINYGLFIPLTNRKLDKNLTVIVIGAGTSGLAAARQLKFFGFEVIPRIGGRVYTIRGTSDLPPADMGGMIIKGIVGNPLITLIHQNQQNPCNIVKMTQKIPIYDSNGKLIDSRKDEMIKNSFNQILDTISYIVEGMGITKIIDDSNNLIKKGGGRKLTLGDAFQLILSQHELRVKTRLMKYWKKYEQLCFKLKDACEKMKTCRNAIDGCMDILNKNGVLLDNGNLFLELNFDGQISEELLNRKMSLRSTRFCLQMAVNAHEEAAKERREIEEILNEYKNIAPSQVYMNTYDKRILDFHLANLEYCIGAPLRTVAVKDWNQNSPYDFTESHMSVKEGLGSIIERLGNDLNIQLNCIVKNIKYNKEGVVVTYLTKIENSNNIGESSRIIEKKINTIKADAVLCTVPLGVLKKTLITDNTLSDLSAIQFDPQLPKWKIESIARLGFGSLNKLTLFFEKPFWDISKSSFGRLNDTTGSRGELFLFHSNGDLPVLVSLFAGEAASITGQLEERIIVQKAMNILNKIFGNNCPLEPKNYTLTKWHLDPYSCGCYSYMKNGSLPEDYDKLAEPLYLDNKKQFSRVFFAGEHTNKQYSSSVHGAFLSGLREAGRIADIFIGQLSPLGEDVQNYENNNENECFDNQGLLSFECQNLNIKEKEIVNNNKPGTSKNLSVKRPNREITINKLNNNKKSKMNEYEEEEEEEEEEEVKEEKEKEEKNEKNEK